MTWANVTDAMSNVWDIVTDCVNSIGSNVVLMTCLCAGLIPIGFKIFKKAKRAVK